MLRAFSPNPRLLPATRPWVIVSAVTGCDAPFAVHTYMLRKGSGQLMVQAGMSRGWWESVDGRSFGYSWAVELEPRQNLLRGFGTAAGKGPGHFQRELGRNRWAENQLARHR